MPGTPAVWFRTWRTVTVSLPWAPNSGHSFTTGVSYPNRPRSASTWAIVAAAPLPIEKL
jgi:hypothetical protein